MNRRRTHQQRPSTLSLLLGIFIHAALFVIFASILLDGLRAEHLNYIATGIGGMALAVALCSEAIAGHYRERALRRQVINASARADYAEAQAVHWRQRYAGPVT